MIDSDYPSVEFNAFDRCDVCNAQAYVLATKNGSELTFCAHHAAQHRDALEMDSWEIAFDFVGLEQLVDNRTVSV